MRLARGLDEQVEHAKTTGFKWQLLLVRDAKKMVFAATEIPRIPQCWTDSVADIMQNARNALDHLAFSLAKIANNNAPLDEKYARRVQFPWAESPSSFGKIDSKIYFAAQDWETFRKLQVFNADKNQIWGPDHELPLIHGIPLAVGMLWTLANIDKHREQLPLWWGVGDTGGAPDEVYGYQTSGAVVPGGPLVVNRAFAEWYFKEGMPDRLEECLIEGYLPIRLRIDNTYFSWPAFTGIAFPMCDVMDIIQRALKAVSTIFYIFEPRLRNGHDPRDVRAASELGWR
jgi:hypothetical protein